MVDETEVKEGQGQEGAADEATANPQVAEGVAESLRNINVAEVSDNLQAGDDSLNKLQVQSMDFILDIPLQVTVELGRTNVIIKDLLQLGQGSVLELDKLAGEPLEILVNGKLVAKG